MTNTLSEYRGRIRRHPGVAGLLRGRLRQLLAYCIIGISLAPASAGGFPDFRWGTGLSEAGAEAGGSPVVSSSETLTHHHKFAGVRMAVIRRFDETGLRQVRYFNRERHGNPEAYVSDFHAVRARLMELYGEPEIDEMQWKNAEFRDQPAIHAKAMAGGHVSYMAAWREEKVRILMTLGKQNLHIAHSLTFTDPAYVPND